MIPQVEFLNLHSKYMVSIGVVLVQIGLSQRKRETGQSGLGLYPLYPYSHP